VVGRVELDDALGMLEAFALEVHPEPRQTPSKLSTWFHDRAPFFDRETKRPPIWEVLCFRSCYVLRGLGIPPSVVPAPNKELNNDDAKDE
jgi:hypothetical protein